MEAVMACQDADLLDFVWRLILDNENDGTPPVPPKVIELFPVGPAAGRGQPNVVTAMRTREEMRAA